MSIVFSYLLYNIFAGLFLVIRFFRAEGGIVPNREFFWLLLFPAIGFGKWKYRQSLKLAEKTRFPEKWFIWKYMIKINWGYAMFSILFIIGVLFVIVFFYNIGIEILDPLGLPEIMNLPILAYLSVMQTVFIFSLFFSVAYGLLLLILIVIPKNKVKRIEREIGQKQQTVKSAMPPQNTVS